MMISDALSEAVKSLRSAGIETPELDAQVILASILKTEKFRLITDSRNELLKKDVETLHNNIERRIKREPVAYITGEKEFYSINFKVTKDVLIPRPETEQIVDIVIEKAYKEASVLDIGTGSGAIAISIKKNRPDLIIDACDISRNSLKIAEENAGIILGPGAVFFSESDIFRAYSGRKFDFILSNPPYLDINQKESMQKDIFFEPAVALFAGDSGREIIKKITDESSVYLNRKGYLIMEIGYDQADYLKAISGNKYSVSVLPDYAGLARIAVLQID